MSGLIRVLLADDHVMFREGTLELLRRAPDLVVVGEACDGHQAVEYARLYRPDVTVLDVHMPGLTGIEAARQIHQIDPAIRILVLTAFDDEHYVVPLLQNGISGYLLKSAPIRDLVQAIYRVHAGELSLDPRILRRMVVKLGAPAAAHSPDRPARIRLEALTEREQQVLQLLPRGLSNREIAQQLSISPRTVQAHLAQIFAKMEVNSRLDAVLMALRWHWITLES